MEDKLNTSSVIAPHGGRRSRSVHQKTPANPSQAAGLAKAVASWVRWVLQWRDVPLSSKGNGLAPC